MGQRGLVALFEVGPLRRTERRDFMERDRFGNVDDAHLAEPARDNRIIDSGTRLLGDQDRRLPELVGAFDAAGQIHHGAARAVFELDVRADVAHLGPAAIDADTQSYWFA